ncbi:MAG: hypothetical protein ACRDWH_11550 [Acidimicrobiia bacterium]
MSDRVIEDAEVYFAGTDDLVISGVGLTVREAAAVPGWVGIVEADLSNFADFKLELRLADETTLCAVMFTVGPEVLGKTLIRGAGQTPGDPRRMRSRPRVTAVDQQATPGAFLT